MEGSRIDLKTFLGLVKPNQYSQSARKQISSWFWGDNFGPNPQTFMIPIYSTIVLYDYSLLIMFVFVRWILYQCFVSCMEYGRVFITLLLINRGTK